MSLILEPVVDYTLPGKPALFQVWIDSNMAVISPPCWDWNSAPKPLADALEEAIVCRAHEYPTMVLPEGQNPRPDGSWD